MISDKLEHALTFLLYCSGSYFVFRGFDVALNRLFIFIEATRRLRRDG